MTTHALDATRRGGLLRPLFTRSSAGLADLVACRRLERTPAGWRSLGPGPQFLVPVAFPRGWVRLRLTVTGDVFGRLDVSADPGGGRSPVVVRRVDVQGGADVDCFLRLPAAAHALRIDLPDGTGEFRLERLRFESLGSVRAFGHAVAAKLRLLRKYVHTGQALRRALLLLARGDLAALWDKLFRSLNGPDLEGREPYNEDEAYAAWRRARALTDADRDRLRAEAAALADPPLLSLLLSFAGGDGARLRRSLDSLRRQTYPRWELCIACREPAVPRRRIDNDPRVRLVEAGAEGEVAAHGHALAAASGEYVALLDVGDELADHALSSIATAVAADRGLDMIYADEDRRTDDGRRVRPYFKPDWSPELFRSWMYTGRPGFYRTSLVRRLGGFRALCGPTAEHDLALRLTADSPRVSHIADVLYHRRQGDVAPDPHPARFAIHGAPTVSIIIPSACRPVRVRGERTFYLIKCLESIQKSTWHGREVVVTHGPRVPAALAARLDAWGARRVAYAAPFNWSAAMNRAAAEARGDHLLFLNDDVEVITPDWLERLLEYSQRPEVGAVGAKLLFPGGRLQHAGVSIRGGRPVHAFYGHRGDHPGYFGSLLVPRDCAAVTGACLMTRADVFRASGGFDESFPLNYNDVDYCLRLRAAGRRVVCTPHARLHHHELGTRPAEARPKELDAFLARWGAALAHDPFHNPNLSPDHLDCRIRS